MWARLNKRGTHVVAKDERRKKKNRLSSSNERRRNRLRCGVGGRPHRCATPSPPPPPPSSTSLSSFSAAWLGCLALTVASSVGRLVCRMNECSWCQPRPITRYSTLTQCLLLLLLASGCCRKRRRGAANDTALSFLCAFYSGLGWSSDIKSSSLLRLDYWNHDFLSL